MKTFAVVAFSLAAAGAVAFACDPRGARPDARGDRGEVRREQAGLANEH